MRWVGPYHPAFRLDPALIAASAWLDEAPIAYNVMLADKRVDRPALLQAVAAVGGDVLAERDGELLVTASLTGPQLLEVVRRDEVLWVDRWSAAELDMDHVRARGGADYVEGAGGFTGVGVNAHVWEGVEETHPDFTGGATAVRSSATAQEHGHATGGIVFGNGASNPAVRGLAPAVGKFYTDFLNTTAGTSRWAIVDDLVNLHAVSHSSRSWGSALTIFYTTDSASVDDILFDHDLAMTQSQSNTGTRFSRGQAWAKNVFSVGAVAHSDDSDPSNDSWAAGNASIGPATDGRIKPTLCGYYDSVGTSDLTVGGYSAANSWTATFGGTSAAAPIVAGHNVLAIEMFTTEVTPGVGLFGQPLRVPGGTAHQNRPHFPTLKALQVANASQYAFTAASLDNRREHQGWGFPDLQSIYDNRGKTYVVDETDVLVQGDVRQHLVTVAAGEPAFKASLSWAEKPSNPAATKQLINDLSLRVVSPTGLVYWGNEGLQDGVWSAPGHTEDHVNPIECVFVESPAAGVWTVEVIATRVADDNHVETPIVDADYGLVVVGGTGATGPRGAGGKALVIGEGCGGTEVVCDQAFYQYGGFDLQNSSWTLQYDGFAYTLAQGQGAWIPPVNPQGFGDDQETVITLPFALDHPGGSTNQLRVCSNGWVTDGTFLGYNNRIGTPQHLLQNTMWAPMWRDLAGGAAGDVYIDSTAQRVVISWVDMPYWSAGTPNTFQIQFWSDGTVHVVYQNIWVNHLIGTYLVGYSTAQAPDPGDLDISANLGGGVQVCAGAPGTPNVSLRSAGRPALGGSVDLIVEGAPLSSIAAFSIVSLQPIPGGVPLTAFGVPECSVYQTLQSVGVLLLHSGAGSFAMGFPSSPTFLGANVYAQAAPVAPGINPFNRITSNGLQLTLGEL
ncbi:MAG: S8 family serine peptidase [Planctomycetota bacterium]